MSRSEINQLKASVASLACQMQKVVGTTASRPASGYVGQIYFNTTTGNLEIWDGLTWADLSGGGVPTTLQIIAGAGLLGGGDLSANVTLSVNLSVTTPLDVASVGSVGNATNVARGDHAHALPFAVLQAVLGAATGTVGLNGQTLTGLAAPVNPSDAATKAYADSLSAGLQLKASVRALAATNIVLSGAQTVDGVALIAGDRVLVTGQVVPTQNGIYVVAAGAWARSADMAAGSHAQGAFAFVTSGTTYGDTGWVCTTDSPNDVVGTNALAFSQFSASQTIQAGNGLTLIGNTMSAVPAGDGSIVVGAGGIGVGTISDAQHGNRGGGALHALAVASGASGFISGADKAKLDALPTAGFIQIGSQDITLAQLQAAGGVLVATFNVGGPLPANARLLDIEVQVNQALTALGLTAALESFQGVGDAAGSLGAGLALLTTGIKGAVGATNPYFSRGGQQLQTTITLTGAFFSALTTGNLTVRYLYTVL